MDRDAGVLVGIDLALSGDGVLLALERAPRENVAGLEDGGGVAEDEIDGAVDTAFAVELAEGMDVESILVGVEFAAVEDNEISAREDGDGLLLDGTGGVLECHVYGGETFAENRCIDENTSNIIIWESLRPYPLNLIHDKGNFFHNFR